MIIRNQQGTDLLGVKKQEEEDGNHGIQGGAIGGLLADRENVHEL